ncbi:MAG: hypothetical protein AB9866_27530 [Syntrophobacteraceae bacterium]
MMTDVSKTFLANVNALIIEKLNTYPDEVRELAIQAIRLSESYPEAAVADQLQAVVRKLAKQQEGDGQ